MTEHHTTPWVEGLTIGAMLRETARTHADQESLVFPQFQTRLTWRQLDAEVDRVARSLLALGIEKGEQVAIWATNWPQWVLLQFASARIGAVLVTVNPAYRAHELSYVLKQSDSVALFLIERFRSSDYFAMLQEAIPDLTSSPPVAPASAPVAAPSPPVATGGLNPRSTHLPKLRHIVSMTNRTLDGMLGWDAFLALGSSINNSLLELRDQQLTYRDAINIQYTSGTTGFPKGAMLTHRNLLLNAYYSGDCQRMTAQDRLCVPVPFYHCFGCVLGVLITAVYGATMVVPHEYFVPEITLATIESERCTVIYGVPTMFIAMLDHPTRPHRDTSSLRTGIMAGSPCPLEIMQRVVQELGTREITIGYGQTEASPIITQTRTDDPLELRVKTVGRPIPDIEVQVVDPLTGATLGDEQPGELCARGHVVMLGYYQMPEQTARAIDVEGWLHTGDIALRQADGYYRITGRIKDMVIRGGENIYPREIEEFLYTHPAIQDVAVVGVPDPKFIEELACWIRLKPGMSLTENELRTYCQGHLAHYKIPRHIRFVNEFPQTVTGKIQKFKIRESMIQDLGLEAVAKRETA